MKHSNDRKGLILLSILKEKCPDCGKGDVFKKDDTLLEMPVMHEKCGHCEYVFDREPGYFLGAMYLSYAIAVLACGLVFLLLHYGFPDLPLIYTPILMGVIIVLIAKKNYKLSRILYIHLFPW